MTTKPKKKKKTLSPAARRKKGHDFERAIAKQLRTIFPESKRGLQNRNNVDLNADVDVPHYFIECKAMVKCNFRAALRQAVERRKPEDTRVPLAICKDDYKPITVTMYYDDFYDMLVKLHGDDNEDTNDTIDTAEALV